MKVDVVADVGNTRIKFAYCTATGFWPAQHFSHAPESWNEPLTTRPPENWAIGGVSPRVVTRFAAWLKERHHHVVVLESFRDIPLQLDVAIPHAVGLDRLFDSLAANHRCPNQRLLVVDAGTAVTINAINQAGIFEGGAIMPGLGLMAATLHQHTALLPLVSVDATNEFPGKDTPSNIQLGIIASAAGAVDRFLQSYKPDLVVFTGGDGSTLFNQVNCQAKIFEPMLTLEGIRIAAEALP